MEKYHLHMLKHPLRVQELWVLPVSFRALGYGIISTSLTPHSHVPHVSL